MDEKIKETNLHDTIDAKIWAEGYMRIIKEHPDILTDEETMLTWFADAIMAGFDEATRRSEVRIKELERLLEESLSIQRAEKEILIKEIEKNKELRDEIQSIKAEKDWDSMPELPWK